MTLLDDVARISRQHARVLDDAIRAQGGPVALGGPVAAIQVTEGQGTPEHEHRLVNAAGDVLARVVPVVEGATLRGWRVDG